ncbi:MAG: AI-2E family transporter [Flavobacteriales bacterium]|jgi:predicted PurR-regulated permease PerM|nr:AI-2E family transporter [Flavobacteriales bacterium]
MHTHDTLQRYVLTLLAVTLTVVALYFGRDLIILTLISALLAFLVLPLARRIEGLGAPRWMGALLVTLLLLVCVLGAFFFMGWQLARFGQDLPALQQAFSEKGNQLLAWVEQHSHIDRREQVQWFNEQVSGLAQEGGKVLLNVFSSTGAALATMVVIPIFVFLLLLLKDKFRTFFQQVDTSTEGTDGAGTVMPVMQRISKLSRKYVRGVVIVLLVLGVLNSIGFLMLGLKYAVLLGFMAGILNIIPYIGVMIGSILPITIALITKDGIGYAVGVLGVCVVTQFLENNVITPKVVGSSVSINPLASIIALLAFGALWGVVGMIVAIPLTGMLKIVCDAVPGLRPYGYLLGEDIEYPKEKRFHLPRLRWSAARGRRPKAPVPPPPPPPEAP